MDFTHTVEECSYGMPNVGDHVIVVTDGGDITLHSIERMSRIHTVQWGSNYVYVTLGDLDVEWDDLTEEKQDRLYESLARATPIDEDE